MWELTFGWRLFLHEEGIAIINKRLNTPWRYCKNGLDKQKPKMWVLLKPDFETCRKWN